MAWVCASQFEKMCLHRQSCQLNNIRHPDLEPKKIAGKHRNFNNELIGSFQLHVFKNFAGRAVYFDSAGCYSNHFAQHNNYSNYRKSECHTDQPATGGLVHYATVGCPTV